MPRRSVRHSLPTAISQYASTAPWRSSPRRGGSGQAAAVAPDAVKNSGQVSRQSDLGPAPSVRLLLLADCAARERPRGPPTQSWEPVVDAAGEQQVARAAPRSFRWTSTAHG